MKVIIFTMAYNAENTITRTIESIINQTFTNFEYYILDNASTDNTTSIIRQYAQEDKRIIPLRVNKNEPSNGGAFFHTLTRATNADYIAWCDADDTYSLDFLEKTIKFATDNKLDIVSCGYDKINGKTGEIIKHRVLNENLILHGELFKDEFIKYRGFTTFLWGKLYSIPFLKETKITGTAKKEQICNDSIWVLNLFKHAKRAGVYGEAMYQYYQYPASLSTQNIEDNLNSYRDLWEFTKDYLESYGKVSKLNEDFFHAIHLSLVDEVGEKIFSSDKLTTKNKLDLLANLFNNSAWKKTLARNADPQFKNLANRKDYIASVKSKINALPQIEIYDNMKNSIFSCFEIK